LWFDVQDALEPYMSRRTVELHWGKHHQDYVEGLNKQLASSPLYGYTLEELIKEAYNNGNPLPEYNNAAQAILLMIVFFFFLGGAKKLHVVLSPIDDSF
jgi:superoxide dismutase